jgi:hypothetical protein
MHIFERRPQPIPETRAEFENGELPICQRDLRQLAQVDEDLAEGARFAVQLVRMRGHISPNTVKYVFPDEDVLTSKLDEEALGKVILNLAAWSDVE